VSDSVSDVLTLHLDADTRAELARAVEERGMAPSRIAKEVLACWLSEQRAQRQESLTPEPRSPMQSCSDPGALFKVSG